MLVISVFALMTTATHVNFCRPRLWWAYEGKMVRWMMACVGYWGYTAGYDVVEYGDDLTQAIRSRWAFTG